MAVTPRASAWSRRFPAASKVLAGGPGVGADLPGQIAEAVVGVGGGQSPRVGDLGQVARGVVGVLRYAVRRIEDLRQAIQRVVAVDRGVRQRVGDGREVPVAVVAVGGALVQRAQVGSKAIERIERRPRVRASALAGSNASSCVRLPIASSV